jgi:hypothetical protein
LGTPTWVKTFKFAVLMSLYSTSLIWLVGLTKDRIAFWAGQVIGVLMSFHHHSRLPCPTDALQPFGWF